jgi:hypothetical protein
MLLLALLVVIIAVYWIVVLVDRAALNEIRSRIDRELAAMEAVERLYKARDHARQEMRREVRGLDGADWSPFGGESR